MSAIKKTRIERMLDEITYDFGSYRPSKFALGFITFIKLVNDGKGEENKSPIIHLKMLDMLPNNDRFIANMIFRGSGKTTLIEYLILYLAINRNIPGFGEIEFMMYIADAIETGVKYMRKNLEYRFKNSEFLQKYITRIDFTDTRWLFTNVNGLQFVVRAYGAQTGVRGAKEFGKRPVFCVADDLISDDDARSDTVISSIEDMMFRGVKPAMHPSRQKTVWLGTPFNQKDPLYKAIDSGAWKANVYPICKSFPVTVRNFIGAWEDRFSYKFIEDMYDSAVKLGRVQDFNQEMMLRIASEGDRLVREKDLRWYHSSQVLDNMEKYNFYITTDFATSEKQSADFSVIFVWALGDNGRIYLVDGLIERRTMNKNVDDLFIFCKKYEPLSVGIEISGQQKGFVSWIKEEMVNRSIYFSLARKDEKGDEGIRPTASKLVRFNTVLPWFRANRFYIPEDMKESFFIEEFLTEILLMGITGVKSKHDDAIDATSMLSEMRLIGMEGFVSGKSIKKKPEKSIWEELDVYDESINIDRYVV